MKKFGLLTVVVFIFFSCEQILEDDIRKEEIALLVPANAIRISNQSIGFLWESNSAASKYRLQIVKPDFRIPETLVIDTLINKNSFYYFLDIGKYEWRVRAENSSYQSKYSSRSLWVDTLNSSNKENER